MIIQKTQAAVDIISCITGKNKSTYISTPITNGLKVIEAIKSNSEYNYNVDIIKKNCEEGLLFATYVRSKRKYVIDPSCFFQKNWSQDDYMCLWEQIIKTYADEIWFNDNWQYSNGCTYEFYIATINAIPTFDATGTVMDTQNGIQLLEQAIQKTDTINYDNSILIKNLNLLKNQ